MMKNTRFITSPNNPQNNVESVVIGANHDEIVEFFNKNGIKTYVIPVNPALDKRVGDHVDLQVLHLGGAEVHCTKLCEILSNIEGIDLTTGKNVQRIYPNDILYNCAVVGKFAFVYHKFYTGNPITDLFKDRDFQVLPVRQGYARCATCVVNERAIITEDPSIAKVAAEQRIDVLLIEKGDVSLKGFPYGFLGGATVKIAPDKMAFTGPIINKLHNRRIMKFLEAHGVSPVYMTEKPCFDIGSVVPLTEYTEEEK